LIVLDDPLKGRVLWVVDVATAVGGCGDGHEIAFAGAGDQLLSAW
jgi:hypothetical protein